MTASWLESDDDTWPTRLRELDHDVYHLPGYVALDASLVGGRASACCCGRGRVLIPLVRRSVPGRDESLEDACSPYGYGGPACAPTVGIDGLMAALREFKTEGKARGLVTSFLRMHPLLNGGLPDLPGDPDLTLVRHGQTVAVDLSRPMEELDRGIRKDHRRNIKILIRNGYTVRFNEWSDYGRFCEIYLATMRRVDAGEFYFFDEEYFSKLRSVLGNRLVQCSVISPEGQMAAGGLFGLIDGMAQYHLAATHSEHIALAPSKLMLFGIRSFLKDAGATVLHLGGGLGSRDDSLYMFKRGFGTGEQPFFTLRIVHDRDAFERLNEEWSARAVSQSAPSDDFFPPYRRQLPDSITR